MNERQLQFVLALLQLALETDRCLGMDEWLGDEDFESWTREDTIELMNLIEEVKA